MTKILSQTINEYDNKSRSNPSLITAGLPSGSIATKKQNDYSNQNLVSDIRPIIKINSQENDNGQHTIISHRTISDTYLNLSRQDMNDVIIALKTLIMCMTNENNIRIDDSRSHHLSMLYSKSTNHNLESSKFKNIPSNHCFYHRQYRQHSLSSNNSLNRHHHIKYHRNFLDDFHNDLHHINCKKQQKKSQKLKYHNPSSYPSYSSNAILYPSKYQPKKRSRNFYQYIQHNQSITSENQYQESIKTKTSSYLFDNLVDIDTKQPICNIKILPQQTHTLQILQRNKLNGTISMDSLQTKDILITSLTPCYLQKRNHDQMSGMGDQINLNKIDAATQWSLQMLSTSSTCDTSRSNRSSKYHDERDNFKLNRELTNSTILTELSQSVTTIVKHDTTKTLPSIVDDSSLINDSCNNKTMMNDPNDVDLKKSSSATINDECILTKSETERFSMKLNIPTCECSYTKLSIQKENINHSSMDDSIIRISFDNDSSLSSSSNNKTNQEPKKIASKRPRQHTSKSSKTNPTIKRSRTHRRSQLNNQPIRIIQSSKTTNLKEDSFSDFFDIDTTFSDVYDRLLIDTTNLEK